MTKKCLIIKKSKSSIFEIRFGFLIMQYILGLLVHPPIHPANPGTTTNPTLICIQAEKNLCFSKFYSVSFIVLPSAVGTLIMFVSTRYQTEKIQGWPLGPGLYYDMPIRSDLQMPKQNRADILTTESKSQTWRLTLYVGVMAFFPLSYLSTSQLLDDLCNLIVHTAHDVLRQSARRRGEGKLLYRV